MSPLAFVDHCRIEVEIEPGNVLAEDPYLGAGSIEHTLDRIGDHVSAYALHGDRRERMRDQHTSHQRIGLITDDDAPGLGNRLEARGKVRFGADNRVIHAVTAAEIAHIAETGIDAHTYTKGVLDALVAPLGIEFRNAALHVERHAHTRDGVLTIALALGITEEDQHGIA